MYKSSTRIVRCVLSSFACYLIIAFFSTLQTNHTLYFLLTMTSNTRTPSMIVSHHPSVPTQNPATLAPAPTSRTPAAPQQKCPVGLGARSAHAQELAPHTTSSSSSLTSSSVPTSTGQSFTSSSHTSGPHKANTSLFYDPSVGAVS